LLALCVSVVTVANTIDTILGFPVLVAVGGGFFMAGINIICTKPARRRRGPTTVVDPWPDDDDKGTDP